MSNEPKYLSKITLSNGKTYIVKDSNALHTSGGTMTGDLYVDAEIKANKLFILSVETMLNTPTNVLVQDGTTKEIKKRSTDKLLEDIGGYSCDENALADGVLKLKLGK